VHFQSGGNEWGRCDYAQFIGVVAMKWRTLASICFLLALPTFALGQEQPKEQAKEQTIERQVKGKPDTNINAGIFTTLRRDCTAGPLPVVRLVTPPAHGKVTVKQGRLRATNLKQCLGTDLPAFIAIYRSAQDFVGQDLFTLEVIGAGGKAQLQRIVVIVAKPAAGQGI
jgi:hypothetical protein